MAHSGKTMTFATDLVPQEDNIYSLGKPTQRWKLEGNATSAGTRWNAITQGQKWSRICLITPSVTTEGSSGILSISCTRGSVVCNASFYITTSHSVKCFINTLGTTNYSAVRIRGVVQSNGTTYIELYDTANSIASGTTQTWHCTYLPLLGSTVTAYTAFTDGTTVPSGYTAVNDFTAPQGDASAPIVGISRSGTTFTATRSNGSTFTFTQRDNNTTYSAGTGLSLSDTTFNHSNSVTAKTSYVDTATTASANGGKIKVTDIKYDTEGHITGSQDRTITLSQKTNFDDTYLKLNGSNNMTADVNIITGDTDKFVNFWYNTNKTAGASWRAGMLGSGSGNTNYFVIQSGTSTTSATTWNNALKIGQNNYDIYNNENRIPNTGNATGSVGGTTTPVYVDAGVIKALSYTIAKSVPSDAKFTDTTYSGNNGISLSGTTFSNSGVRATTINGNYLRVNTNGTNADLTIPFATNANNAANSQSNYGAKSFIIEGDADTYYPTLITGYTAHNAWTLLNITRGYSEQAPDTWNTASHKGGLTLTILSNGDSSWGGNHQLGVAKLNTIFDLSQSYCTMVADIQDTTFGLVVWLRGGNAKYWVTSNGGQSVSITTWYEEHTQSSNTVAPRTDINTDRINSYRWNNLWGISKANISSTKWGITYYSDTAGTFAGTEAGTSGQYLKSNGSSAPTWATFSNATVGLGNVENTKLSTWAGSSNITTVGTISTGTWHGTKIANDYIANPKVTIAGNDVSLGGSLAAATLISSLGLSNALHFIGITSTTLTDGSTTATLTAKSTGSLSKTTGFVDGDVVMDGDQLREYVWSGSAWRLLGITTSTAYTQPASTATNTWIAQISQGTDGKITATTGSLNTSGTWSGTASKATTTANTTDSIYPVGVKSGATTTLLHDTSITMKGNAITAVTYNSTAASLTSETSTTANTAKYATLTLGNNANVSSTTAHSEGQIIMYSAATQAHTIKGTSTTAAYTHTLPNNTGLLVSLSGGTAKGSSTKPVYIPNTGIVTECSTYAGGTKVTFNGADKGASTASFYAPTTGGTAGHTLIGAGTTTAPAWYGGTVMSGSAAASWKTAFNGTTDATASNAAAVTIAGGLGIAKSIIVGEIATVADDILSPRFTLTVNGTDKAYLQYNTTDDSIDFIFV